MDTTPPSACVIAVSAPLVTTVPCKYQEAERVSMMKNHAILCNASAVQMKKDATVATCSEAANNPEVIIMVAILNETVSEFIVIADQFNKCVNLLQSMYSLH
jgi:hypothetical protein